MSKPGQGTVFDGFSSGNGEFVIIELSAVLSNDTPLQQEVLERVSSSRAGAEYQATIKMLTSRADVVKTSVEELSSPY